MKFLKSKSTLAFSAVTFAAIQIVSMDVTAFSAQKQATSDRTPAATPANAHDENGNRDFDTAGLPFSTQGILYQDAANQNFVTPYQNPSRGPATKLYDVSRDRTWQNRDITVAPDEDKHMPEGSIRSGVDTGIQ